MKTELNFLLGLVCGAFIVGILWWGAALDRGQHDWDDRCNAAGGVVVDNLCLREDIRIKVPR